MSIILNPKFEYRSTKQIRITKIQMTKTMRVQQSAGIRIFFLKIGILPAPVGAAGTGEHLILSFDVAQGGELVEPCRI